MNKKTIQILVIVAAFLASGFVLYNGFLKNRSETPSVLDTSALPGTATPAASGGSTVTNPSEILPYGTSLDFKKVLDKQPLRFNAFEYPKVNTTTEVGVLEKDLVKAQTRDTGNR